ncbi:MAG: UTP--glucose-1-phosphate uridylyltransferase [Victivallaceae bacterium]
MSLYEDLSAKLAPHNQQQVLRFFNELDSAAQQKLAGQLNDLDFDQLDKLIQKYVLSPVKSEPPRDIEPAPYYPAKPADSEQAEFYARALVCGEELIRRGKVAILTVAGGQGSRLGFDGPKGSYLITPIQHKSLFECFAGAILRSQEKYDAKLVWYIMTSPLNNQQTMEFFAQNNYFGMDRNNVVFFAQGTMPAVAYDGKLLLAGKDSLALAPDGHGGTLLALKKSGSLARMIADEVEYISYFQVDNPLVPVVNPLFIGLHALCNSQVSAIMLPKTNAFEKLGNFCRIDGRTEIIEYSDLPEELAIQTTAEGTLRFIAGSPAIQVFSRDFIEQLTGHGDLSLPWHRADKKVAFVDDSGAIITPEKPNAVKLESFIFDSLPLAKEVMILEGSREDMFGPTKNKTGVDSVESCRMMLMERDARRLAAAGVMIPRHEDGSLNCEVEISPRLAIDAADVANLVADRKIIEIKTGEKFILD